MQLFTVQRSETQTLYRFVAVFVFTVFQGNSIHFIALLLQPESLKAFELANIGSHLFLADKVSEYYYTVLIKKIQLLRGYSISQLKMTIPFFHSNSIALITNVMLNNYYKIVNL